jgi:pimeloyl-ACP methyl ester carboxylesterase
MVPQAHFNTSVFDAPFSSYFDVYDLKKCGDKFKPYTFISAAYDDYGYGSLTARLSEDGLLTTVVTGYTINEPGNQGSTTCDESDDGSGLQSTYIDSYSSVDLVALTSRYSQMDGGTFVTNVGGGLAIGANVAWGNGQVGVNTTATSCDELSIRLIHPRLPGTLVTGVAVQTRPLEVEIDSSDASAIELALLTEDGTSGGSMYGTVSGASEPSLGPDGRYHSIATYTPPNVMPSDEKASLVLKASQKSGSSGEHRFILGSNPIFLVHGLWSSPTSMSDLSRISGATSALTIATVNYSAVAHEDFASETVQSAISSDVQTTLNTLMDRGYLFDKIDMIGHSMGGLAAAIYARNRNSEPDAIHVANLVTIGTPWNGSALAPLFEARLTQSLHYPANAPGSAFGAAILLLGLCDNLATVADLLGCAGSPAGTALAALSPGSAQLAEAVSAAAALPTYALAGRRPDSSGVELGVNFVLLLIEDPSNFQPIGTLLDPTLSGDHDLVVPVASQLAGPGVLNPTPYPNTIHFGNIPFALKVPFNEAEIGTGFASELANPELLRDALCHLGHCGRRIGRMLDTIKRRVRSADGSGSGYQAIADLLNLNLSGGSALDGSALSIANLDPLPLAAGGFYRLQISNTSDCQVDDLFAMTAGMEVHEAVSGTRRLTLPVGVRDLTRVSLLATCSGGDYVSTHLSFSVATRHLIGVELAGIPTHMTVGEQVSPRVFASYDSGDRADVTESATYVAAGPGVEVVQGSVRAIAPGNSSIVASFESQSDSVNVITSTASDEIFQSGFEAH